MKKQYLYFLTLGGLRWDVSYHTQQHKCLGKILFDDIDADSHRHKFVCLFYVTLRNLNDAENKQQLQLSTNEQYLELNKKELEAEPFFRFKFYLHQIGFNILMLNPFEMRQKTHTLTSQSTRMYYDITNRTAMMKTDLTN